MYQVEKQLVFILIGLVFISCERNQQQNRSWKRENLSNFFVIDGKIINRTSHKSEVFCYSIPFMQRNIFSSGIFFLLASIHFPLLFFSLLIDFFSSSIPLCHRMQSINANIILDSSFTSYLTYISVRLAKVPLFDVCRSSFNEYYHIDVWRI